MKDSPEILEDNTIDVAVSYDGTSHHRGFKSCHGVGIVVSIDTGEILDAAVISKTCETCQRSPYPKNSAEFKQWQEKHISEGKCFRTLMDQVQARKQRLQKLSGLDQYQNIKCDTLFC